MTSRWMKTVASAWALAAALSGCDQTQDVMAPVGQVDSEELATLGGQPALSFEQYVEKHVAERPDGLLMVERDIHMENLDQVRAHWEATHNTTGALSVWRPQAGVDNIWDRNERWNITYCIRPSDFGTDYDRLVEMMHRAASGWEAAADVRFVHVSSLDGSNCNRQNNSVKYNVERNTSWTGDGLAAGMGFPGYSRPNRFLELGKTWNWTDEELLAVLIHEMGHSLGFVHEHDTAQGCGFVTDDNAHYRQLTCYDGRSAMHYPFEDGWLDPDRDLNFISQRDVEGAQSVYGAPTNVINTADGTVYARKRSTGDIYRRGLFGIWTKIGGPGQAFVAVGNTLYGQTPGGGSPVKYTGSGWVYIGGPAGQIFPCLDTLCATDKFTGNVAKYNAAGNNWTTIGGPGSRFASTATELFGIGPWQDDYTARYSGSGANWSIVGGGASELIGGGNKIYALSNVKDAIRRYDGANTWTQVGTSGRQYLAANTALYGLRPDSSFIMKFTGSNWVSIHGAAAKLYGSAGQLFATMSTDESIKRFNPSTSTWTPLGKP